MTNSYAKLGPVGELLPAPSPQSGVGVSAERQTSEMITLGGSRVVQMTRARHKTWELSYTWKRPSEIAWLGELASGGVVGPIYFFTSKAAVENLAPPLLQVGGSGVVARRRIFAAGDAQIAVSRQIPISSSTLHCLSFLSNGSGSLTRKLFTAAGLELSSVVLSAGASGYRVTDSFTTPSNAAYMTLTPTAGVGQIRLTEGAHTGFMAGDGVAPVRVVDPQETLQRAMAGDHRSDFSVTIQEVG